jgi:DtxR family Mn-dependent transcriptional regulator
MKDIWKEFDATELTHSSIHHLMAVHQLIKENGYARSVDISRLLNLTRGSTSITLHKLIQKEYLERDANKFYRLTKRGNELISSVLNKRNIVKQFLSEVLNLPEEIAETDACKVEHLLSKNTGRKLLSFMGYFLSDNTRARDFRIGFDEFQFSCHADNCQFCENNCFFSEKQIHFH